MTQETILITGATGKIGGGLTRHFRGKGWTVIAVSRSAERLDELARESDGPGPIEKVAVDLTSPDAARILVGRLAATGTLPHHLVNNARDLAQLRIQASGLPTLEQWVSEFQLGVVVAYELATALADAAASPLRSVVNVASIYGVVAMNPHLYDDPPRQAPIHYGIVKAALIQLTRELAVRSGPRGIRVNAVSYGGVEGRTNDAFRARYATLVPNGRMLHDGDIPGAIDFLTSEMAAGVTGHNLMVDGGWTAW